MAQGANFINYQEIFNSAVSYDPLYLEYYFKTARYLLPRWHGKEGAWEAFAHAVADLVGGRCGDFIYAQIVLNMNGTAPNHTVLHESRRIIWPRVKRGLESIAAFETMIKANKRIRISNEDSRNLQL